MKTTTLSQVYIARWMLGRGMIWLIALTLFFFIVNELVTWFPHKFIVSGKEVSSLPALVLNAFLFLASVVILGIAILKLLVPFLRSLLMYVAFPAYAYDDIVVWIPPEKKHHNPRIIWGDASSPHLRLFTSNDVEFIFVPKESTCVSGQLCPFVDGMLRLNIEVKRSILGLEAFGTRTPSDIENAFSIFEREALFLAVSRLPPSAEGNSMTWLDEQLKKLFPLCVELCRKRKPLQYQGLSITLTQRFNQSPDWYVVILGNLADGKLLFGSGTKELMSTVQSA